MNTIAFTGNHFQALPNRNTLNNNCEEQPSHHLFFKDFTVPTNAMTEHEVAPPPHVWDKIACILDEQDRQKAETAANLQQQKKKILYWGIAALTVALLTAYLLWLS
jgi:hypothetical protein